MYVIYEGNIASRHDRNPVTEREYVNPQNGRKLATAILDNSVQSLSEHDWCPSARFVGDSPILNILAYGFHNFARELFMWNRCSRRANHLPHTQWRHCLR